MPSGYSTTLPADVLLDTGVLYIGSLTPWGVSKGGLTFDPGTEWANVDFDGKRAPVAGLDRKTYSQPVISGTIIAINAAKAAQLEPGSTSNVVGSKTTVTPNSASKLLSAGDYLTDVKLVYKRGNAGGYAIVHFPKALLKKYGPMKGADKDTVEIPIEIEARQDLSVSTDTDVIPYTIELDSVIS